MKKIVFVGNVILFALVCLIFILGIDRNKSIRCNVGTPKEIERIEERETLTTENILQNLLFNGEALPYDAKSSTFYLPLSMQTKDWEFGELTSGAKDVDIIFTQDFHKINKTDVIANNQSFQFLAFSGQEYRYYNLVFTGLPIMNITINEGDLEDSAQIDMSLYASKSKSDWVKKSMASIRVRGNTSRIFPKKSYKMELTKYDNAGNIASNNLSLLDMRKDNDWILYAMYNDDTKVRDKLSIDIWNQFGAIDNPFSAEFGTKLEYVELIVNGDYYGIYGLMEPVDAKKLDVTKSSEENSQEYIYKRTIPYVLSSEHFVEDSDIISRCGFELKGISKYGDISLKTWEPLSHFIQIQELESDEDYAREVLNTVDVNSVTNSWLFLQIVSGMDNRAKNMYYVAKMTSDGTRLFFVPWDLDLTWGNVSKETPDLYTAFEPEILEEEVNWETGQRVIDLNVGDARLLAKEKWSLLRRTILTNESLTKRIEELENTVVNSGAMKRDMQRWPQAGHTEDYSSIKKYAVDKMQYLDSYFSTLGEE